MAALAAAVASSIKQNYRLLGAKGFKERVFGPEKLGARGTIALLSFLRLRCFVTFFVGTVSSLVHRCASERLCTGVPDFKPGMAYQPPLRPLKALHNETPVPLFARSRLSQFKRGRTRASNAAWRATTPKRHLEESLLEPLRTYRPERKRPPTNRQGCQRG